MTPSSHASAGSGAARLLAPADVGFLCRLCREAGERIMEHYHEGVAVTAKADRSPLTAADLDAHNVIVAGLQGRWPEWPVLSEEGADIPYAERRQWQVFWLVDPLDGTKEFLKRNGEFTVNIALVAGNEPVFGVVHAPASGVLYRGGPGQGAHREVGEGTAEPIRCRSAADPVALAIVGSRSHGSPEMAGFLEALEVKETVVVGSSLKFCRVAEGSADLYPRFGPTMEWDTAAGQALVVGAGGRVVDLAGMPMRYNQEQLRNGPFLATGGPWPKAWGEAVTAATAGTRERSESPSRESGRRCSDLVEGPLDPSNAARGSRGHAGYQAGAARPRQGAGSASSC
ncbi:MAG: 3'(2'),5'-bisphosphate nucleotidase CysQ [Verrucomicrobiales bacterium]|nr:3'(2'),5'-bisphosphate nucleotidase CysQ [Planctomycetota bacterium]MCP5524687.1 3'(2'),5'-bisphosphate nucleotidase CysQ [Verrucomicrobiales bacterium]